MKLIIAGCRDYENYEFVKSKVENILQNISEEIEVISGQCDTGKLTFVEEDGTWVFGVDGLGEKFAKEKGYKVKLFPANWDSFGKKAAYFRNRDMARYATHCICFWDGKSKGTEMMIKLAVEFNVKTKIVKIVI